MAQYDLVRFFEGRIELVEQMRDPDRARDASKAISAIRDGVFAVRRTGHTGMLWYAFRGKVGTAEETVARMTAADALPVLRINPAPEETPAAEPDETPEATDDDDAPRKRTRRPRTGPTETKAAPNAPAEFKAFDGALISADDATGVVEAIVSVFGVIDDGDDLIHPGAFVKTLVERGGRVRVLDHHNSRSTLNIVGRPLEMREVGRDDLPLSILAKHPEATGGLYTKTQYLIETNEGRGVYQRIKSGALGEYSIGIDPLDVDMSKVTGADGKPRVVRNIRQVRLWEYSPVVWGMNPATATVSVKSADDAPETPAETEKEMTPDGPVMRLGDYLLGETMNVIGAILSGFLRDGYLDDAEYSLMTALLSQHMTAARNELPQDVALRALPSIADWLMLFSREPDQERKTVVTPAQSDQVSDLLQRALAVLAAGAAPENPAPEPDATKDDDGPQLDPEAPTPAQGAGPQGDAAPDKAELLAKMSRIQAELEALK